MAGFSLLGGMLTLSAFNSGQRAWAVLGYRSPKATFTAQNSCWNNNSSKNDTVLVWTFAWVGIPVTREDLGKNGTEPEE